MDAFGLGGSRGIAVAPDKLRNSMGTLLFPDEAC